MLACQRVGYGLINVLAEVPSVRDAMTQAALAIKLHLQ